MFYRPVTISLLLLFSLALVCNGYHGNSTALSSKYPFHIAVSTDPTYQYDLYWKVQLEEEIIQFAVNVSVTTGWIGFGLSPNGQMPGSDVVIGWITDDGVGIISDRYAVSRSIPVPDESQDWALVSGGVENGHTILEFKRHLTTCDMKDIDITTSTSNVLWSIGNTKPSIAVASDLEIVQHSAHGSVTLNLLGGQQTSILYDTSESGMSFSITAENVTVPAVDTTYWCIVVQLPIEERYIYKFSPKIAESSKPYVHHMLLYQCATPPPPGWNGVCHSAPPTVGLCRGTNILAGWAIGGEGFSYPEEVAYKIGGPGSFQYALLEIHYDNPNLAQDILDQSGITFYYTQMAEKVKHLAGVMAVGHHVTPNMLIPPQLEKYIIVGLCSDGCTKKFLPLEGINVFGGLLHTHLAGTSLVLQHYRFNRECNILEELAPVDMNLNYQTDYQQVNSYPREVKILPGDALMLNCTYKTSGFEKSRINVTLGGEGTHDEMCLTFLFYYPKTDLSLCTSMPAPIPAYTPLEQELQETQYKNLTTLLRQSLGVSKTPAIRMILDEVEWSPDLASSLQQSALNSSQLQLCIKEFTAALPPQDQLVQLKLPNPSCKFVPVSKCEATTPYDHTTTCCSSIGSFAIVNLVLLEILSFVSLIFAVKFN